MSSAASRPVYILAITAGCALGALAPVPISAQAPQAAQDPRAVERAMHQSAQQFKKLEEQYLKLWAQAAKPSSKPSSAELDDVEKAIGEVLSLLPRLRYITALRHWPDRVLTASIKDESFPTLRRLEGGADVFDRGDCVLLDRKAQVYVLRKDYGTAERLYLDALAEAESKLNDLLTREIYVEVFFLDEAQSLGPRLNSNEEAARRWQERAAIMVETVAMIADDLARMYESQGNYHAARPHYERVVVLREKHRGQNDPATARALLNAGNNVAQLAEYAQAEECFERALKIFRQQPRSNAELVPVGAEPYDVDTALAARDLGRIYWHTGRPKLALPLLDEALLTLSRIHGPTHSSVASVLSDKAEIAFGGGDFATSQRLLYEILRISERNDGRTSRSVAWCLNKLAAIHALCSREEEALRYAEESVAIAEQVYPPDHPDLATALDDLGRVLRRIGQYEAAEQLHKRSLAIVEKTYGAGHAKVANNCYLLALLYDAQGRQEEAISCYTRAASLASSSPNADHQQIAKLCHLEIASLLICTF